MRLKMRRADADAPESAGSNFPTRKRPRRRDHAHLVVKRERNRVGVGPLIQSNRRESDQVAWPRLSSRADASAIETAGSIRADENVRVNGIQTSDANAFSVQVRIGGYGPR